LLAASYLEVGSGRPVGLFNGKLDSPGIIGRALTLDAIRRVRDGECLDVVANGQLRAAWDFAAEPAAAIVYDRSVNRLHGDVKQEPMRAATSHRWGKRAVCFADAPSEYGAIHFHDDDLGDAEWQPDFEFVVPEVASAVCGVRLESEAMSDVMPIFVVPSPGAPRQRVAFVVPTFTYLAYGNDRQYWDVNRTKINSGFTAEPRPPQAADLLLWDHPELGSSLYDVHPDGSGVCYVSRLRPIVTMRPTYTYWLTRGERNLALDLRILEWLESIGQGYDVLTDEDVHADGFDSLSQYRVVLTGSHPEYVSEPIYDAFETYLGKGGRVFSFGGNGFYWVTSVFSDRPHIIEVRRGTAGTRAWDSAPGESFHVSSGESGGLWRHRGRDPRRLFGVGFAAEGFEGGCGYRINRDAYDDPRLSALFAGIAPDETIGDFGTILGGAVSDEIDRADWRLGTPGHAVVLASSAGLSDYYQQTPEDVRVLSPSGHGGRSRPEEVRADIALVRWPKDGCAVSVGSIGFAGALDANAFDNNVARFAMNTLRLLLADGPV
jgi:N,N-dimethylformamidase